MLNDNARFFTEDFKSKTITLIKIARIAFSMEVFKESEQEVKIRPHDYATVEHFAGWRFFSDEQCWNSFVTVVGPQPWAFSAEFVAKKQAAEIEHAMDLNREVWRKNVWKAVKDAAACDHHYEYDKEY